MSRVQKSLVINAALASTWQAISTMNAVADWHPNVARVDVLSEHNTGVGASRRVEFHDGNSIVETVIEEAHGQFTTLALSEMPLLEKAAVTIATDARSAASTEVTFTINYETGLGPVGWLLGVLMMKRVFSKAFGQALDGLGHHLELVHDRG